MENLLSERAKVSRDWEDFMYKKLTVVNSNPYHEKNNPSGYINFGTAVNYSCDDVLHPKLKEAWKLDFDSLGYKEGRGTMRLRRAMANIMSVFLESHKPISPDDLFCLTGVTSCIDLLVHCLADPGDVILVPTPMYGRIFTNFMQRSQVEIFPIHVITDNDDEICLTMEKIIFAFESAVAANNVVRGIFLINPNNPLGNIYSPELLMDIMSFCSANSLHVIVDEVFALAVFSEDVKFHSILKFPKLPDPDRTHVLYGLSKDFALAGLRVGVIHTKCQQLQNSLQQLSFFQAIPYPVMTITAAILEDMDWCKMFIKRYQKCLAENYEICSKYLKEIGVKVRDCQAGFFVWVDLRKICGSTFDGERNLFNFIFDNVHLYIGPGEEFHCAQPGWFRIVFTEAVPTLKEGLKRLTLALEKYKESK